MILVGSNHLLNNSLYKDYSHPDDHTRQATDTAGFKPFTMFAKQTNKNKTWNKNDPEASHTAGVKG